MKASVILSVILSAILLAIGLVTGLTQQQQLSTLRQDRDQLADQAVRLGIPVGASGQAGGGHAKRQREALEKSPHSTLAQIISCRDAMRDFELQLEQPTPELQIQFCDLKEQLMDLDPEEMKRFILGLVAQKTQPEQERERRQTIGIAVRLLAAEHPDAALSLLASTPDLLKEVENGGNLIKSSLANWATTNPADALAWIRQNPQTIASNDRDKILASALSGAARTDPTLAFRMLSETEGDKAHVIGRIAESAASPENRTAILSAFRDYLAAVSDPKERDALKRKLLGGFGESLGMENFETATSWIAGQNFSAEECDQLVRDLPEDATIEQSGEWIHWMTDRLPPGKLGARVERLIESWATEDYIAVAKWLDGEPEGPAKTAAVGAYAKTVAGYDPQAAAQWAMTMPEGPQRQNTLKRIYQNWPERNFAAKAAFAAEHGITTDLTNGK